ncbi:MAG: alpha-amylase family glycosyl hydrolase [Nitrospirota bacterium]|nr:alpha-amylase family glycosyl hydrolase [Nitrospirota bacterium]
MTTTHKSIAEIDLAKLTAGRDYTPSPTAWEDEVLYFLMLDRFSDGKEADYRNNAGTVISGSGTPRYDAATDYENAIEPKADSTLWRAAGKDFTGGTLKGLQSKLGYLQRMGITAIWISPLFKQVTKADTYHGYGVQNFLEVEPRFGTREDLKQLVKAAHDMDMRVILDVIVNHSGDVFAYTAGSPEWSGGKFEAAGFRKDIKSQTLLPFEPGAAAPTGWPNGAVWPAELQEPGTFTRMGQIRESGWNNLAEYLSGDFYALKDIDLGNGPEADYHPSHALRAICEACKYWIAYADLDGFRVDTVKHMDPGATRYMTAVLHEFAQSIGKDNFYLIGEIVGERPEVVSAMQRRGLDAALGINEVMPNMEKLVKGDLDPIHYFDLFRNGEQVGQDSQTWFRDRVVTMFDDHDQVDQGQHKQRFCAHSSSFAKLAPAAIALNATTLGIPCIYYGSEQGFDGEGGHRGDEGYADRYIRESMFGGAFGAFRSKGKHFFDENHAIYQATTQVLQLRAQHKALRRGRQYLREISGDGITFGYPRRIGQGLMRSVVPWSRLFNNQEYLLAINTDPDQPRTAWVTVDANITPPGSALTCIHSSTSGILHTKEMVTAAHDGRSMVHLTVPAAGFVVYC